MCLACFDQDTLLIVTLYLFNMHASNVKALGPIQLVKISHILADDFRLY